MEAANFEAAGQDDVVIEARRPLVVGVVVLPKANMERHRDEFSAGGRSGIRSATNGLREAADAFFDRIGRRVGP